MHSKYFYDNFSSIRLLLLPNRQQRTSFAIVGYLLRRLWPLKLHPANVCLQHLSMYILKVQMSGNAVVRRQNGAPALIARI